LHNSLEQQIEAKQKGSSHHHQNHIFFLDHNHLDQEYHYYTVSAPLERNMNAVIQDDVVSILTVTSEGRIK